MNGCGGGGDGVQEITPHTQLGQVGTMTVSQEG